jgi:hypothetical protein
MSSYFAYGSNMSSARLLARVSGAELRGRCRLRDWRLAFNKPGRDGSGKANLVEALGDLTWGVAWRLPDDAWPVLDRFEPGYERRVFQLTETDGQTLQAHAYLYACPAGSPWLPPSDDYLAQLLRGALEHDLPTSYIAKIRSLRGHS